MGNALSNYEQERLNACRRLGIFDSGVGGLSILKSFQNGQQQKSFTGEHSKEIIYLADTARFPYGEKKPEEIFAYTEQIIHWLEFKRVDLIIFGCNTASAIAYERIKQITDLPALNLIQPTAAYIAQTGLNVGVLATEATVKNRAFSKAINMYAPNLLVKEIAAPDLVQMVETGQITQAETQERLTFYIEKFIAAGIQMLVLGCTHFAFLKDYFQQLAGNQIKIVDPAELIVQILACQDIEIRSEFFVTGDKNIFANTAEICLGYPLKNLNHLPLKSMLSIC